MMSRPIGFGVVCFFFLLRVHCIEDMVNNSHHRSTVPLSYFWVRDRHSGGGEWRRRPMHQISFERRWMKSWEMIVPFWKQRKILVQQSFCLHKRKLLIHKSSTSTKTPHPQIIHKSLCSSSRLSVFLRNFLFVAKLVIIHRKM
jgi:hypothetical protein